MDYRLANGARMLGLSVLIVSVIVAGCGGPASEPSAPAPTVEVPVPTTQRQPTAAPPATLLPVASAADARDVALGYAEMVHGIKPPPAGVAWQEENTMDDELVGASGVRYAVGDWVVTVTFPIVSPEATIYHVSATNRQSGFQWEGEVDSAADVTQIAMVQLVQPDVQFNGVSFSYHASIASSVQPSGVSASSYDEPDWAASPEHLEFSFEGYVPAETFHAPRILVYPAAKLEAASDMGAAIIGSVRQALSQRPVAVPPNSILPGLNAAQLMCTRAAYVDFANGSGLRYLTQMGQAYFPINNRDLFYAFQGLTDDGKWYVSAILPVSHPDLAVDGSEIPGDEFDAFAERFETYAAEMAAQLDAQAPGSFTPDLSLLDAMMASVRVDVETGVQVVAWGGFVEGQPGGAQFDDCLVLQPEGAGEVGLRGIDNGVEAQIESLRDSATYAHFWGALHCPAIDCGGCQLVVERLREDQPGPFFDADTVAAWEGTIVGLPEGAQFDDYFEMAGEFPVGFGVEGMDSDLVSELNELRDTGMQVRIWGDVEAGIPDAFGTRIRVMRIDVLGESVAAAEWQPYVNDAFGFSLMMPPDATLLEGADGRSLQIGGPLVENERWPMIEVSYLDTGFYHPPDAADLRAWVTERLHGYDRIDDSVHVDGLPAVRVTTAASPQAYGMDEFYLAKDDQLFRISFIHTKGQQDWDLYTRFLDSFRFQ